MLFRISFNFVTFKFILRKPNDGTKIREFVYDISSIALR